MKRFVTFIISLGLLVSLSSTVLASDNLGSLQWYLNGHTTADGEISLGINLSKFNLRLEDEIPVVAVIDTGVDYTQEDLASQMWVNPYPDQLEGTYGYDFGDHDADPYDKDGHGTHVAGIIAAAENEYGIDGVCDARIMALKVERSSDGALDADAIVEAFDYIYRAMKLGVNVKAVNCSWGYTSGNSAKYDEKYSTLYKNYIDKIGKLGALTVFAAGNDVVDGDQANYVPYDIDSKYLVIVGATDERERPAWFTTYGQTKVDLFAPGINILSCSPVYSTVVWKNYKYICEFDDIAYDKHPEDNEFSYIPTSHAIYTPQEIGLYSRFACFTDIKREDNNNYLEFTVAKSDPSAMVGEVNRVDEGIGFLYVDVTDMNFDLSYEYEIMFDIASASGDVILWQKWYSPPKLPHNAYEDLRFVTVNGRTYMRICGLDDDTLGYWRCSDGKSRILIDNMKIYRTETMTTSQVKYNIKEGTSMAAPIVSGAVALLARTNSKATALELREVLLESTREVPVLKKYCVTGGLLDLSKVRIPGQKFKILEFKESTLSKSYSKYKNKKFKLSTKKTGTGSLSPNIVWSSTNTKYAKVNQSGQVTLKKAGIGHKVGIKVTCYNGKKNITKKCVISIKK